VRTVHVIYVAILGSAILVATDVALDLTAGVGGWATIALSAVETALVIPWAVYVVRLDRQERAAPTGADRLRQGAVHALNIALVALCLGEKWLVLHEAVVHGATFYAASYRIYTVAAWVLVAIGLLGRGSRAGRFLFAMSEHPARLMSLSFGIAALLGALVLSLPQSLRHIGDANFVDALFTAVSAVCVTGLTVDNVAETYSGFGQVVILVLVQIGGLGIMVLSGAFTILAGRHLKIRTSAVLAEMVDVESLASLRRLVVRIVVFTGIIEAVGAAALYAGFLPYPQTDLDYAPGLDLSGAGGRLWAAVFHSISAFCNAGFSVFFDGMVPFARSWSVCLTLSVLIVLGGLGFPVLDELYRRAATRLRGDRPRRASLHARVVLLTTAVLLVAGTVAYGALEWGGSMDGLAWHDKLLASLFQSVTTRTAGFNTVSFGAMGASTLMLTCVLMFLGASPGSTGGGIKTTTLAVLFATLRAEFRSLPRPRLLDRTVPAATVRRALAVTFASVGIVSIAVFGLLLLEEGDAMDLIFEGVSAFGTVGLSTGITPSLSEAGRLLVTATMFVGRIGPLTLALAVAATARRPPYELPEERVSIG